MTKNICVHPGQSGRCESRLRGNKMTVYKLDKGAHSVYTLHYHLILGLKAYVESQESKREKICGN